MFSIHFIGSTAADRVCPKIHLRLVALNDISSQLPVGLEANIPLPYSLPSNYFVDGGGGGYKNTDF